MQNKTIIVLILEPVGYTTELIKVKVKSKSKIKVKNEND